MRGIQGSTCDIGSSQCDHAVNKHTSCCVAGSCGTGLGESLPLGPCVGLQGELG